MTTDLRRLADTLEEKLPLAFRAAHPRNITPPNGYFNPRHYASTLVGNLMVVQDKNMRQLPHVTEYSNTLGLIANKVPTYFIAQEFVEAVSNTDLPGDFKFAEIKWPLEALLFVLPDRFTYAYYGCHAPFISMSRCREGQYPDILPGLPALEIPYLECYNEVDRILVDFPVFYPNSLPVSYNGNYPLSRGIEVFAKCPLVDTTAYERQKHPDMHSGVVTQEMTPDNEKIFFNKALMLAIKLVLAVACRPGLVETGHRTRPAKMNREKIQHKEMWSPNVIGRTYRIPRQPAAAAAAEGNGISGERAKPRFTYRRGHYTWQAKRFKDVEFISVEQMPHLADGTIDFTAAGEPLGDKFRAVHERQWIEGIIFGDPASAQPVPQAP
jgi:hypothetical protein